MRVQFHGAARTVTGSCTLLEASGTSVLVDCGQFQGDDELERHNRDRFAFRAKDLKAVVLTHGHIDHVGRAPRLVREGFRGRVLCTRATAQIATLMLLDGAKIMKEDARRGGPEPMFDESDVEVFANLMDPLRYGESVAVGRDVTLALTDAGHILGSAHALVTMREGDRTVAFGVSGDVGVPGRPVIGDPVPFRALDYLQVETTYGDRDHRSQEDSVTELEAVLRQAVEDGGVVVMPAFALGRTQDVLWHVNAMKEAGRLKDLDVYVDSPLATRLTAVFHGNTQLYDAESKERISGGDDPLKFSGLRFVGDPDESDRVRREAKRALIVSASGMCQGGRVVRHLEALLPRPSTKVVIVGYQAPGTLGRRLVDGWKVVRIRGHEVPVNATIHTLGGFSAHAGRKELLDWVGAIRERPPRRVFLVHGEPAPLESFARAVESELRLSTHIPYLGESIEL